MNKYRNLRWDRLKELGLEIKYIKDIVKNKYKYQVKENKISDFIKNIKDYKNIYECDLLNILEEEAYRKASIFSIMRYKKNKEKMPIIDDFTNDIFNTYFKEKNGINFSNGEYYSGKLDNCYKITHYNKNKNFVVIKLNCIFSEKLIETEDGIMEEYDVDIYDCCKFIVDIKNMLVVMFYNDFKSNQLTPSKQVTIRKDAFRALFNVTNKNILRFSINTYLEKYFKKYMEEYRNGDIHKLVSIIEASSIDNINEERSLIRSVKRDYIHSPKRLEAIDDDIKNDNLTISEIECCIDDVIIDLEMKGEIICINNFLFKEVIDNVCKEFFDEYKLL